VWAERVSRTGARAATERGGRSAVSAVSSVGVLPYIIVLNPLIIGTQPDVEGDFLGGGGTPNLALVAAATALVAGVMTIAMGAFANYPLALATGLGLNAFVTFAIASRMTWPDAMGLVARRATRRPPTAVGGRTCSSSSTSRSDPSTN